MSPRGLLLHSQVGQLCSASYLLFLSFKVFCGVCALAGFFSYTFDEETLQLREMLCLFLLTNSFVSKGDTCLKICMHCTATNLNSYSIFHQYK